MRQKETSQEDYDKCVTLWRDRGMKTMRDYLIAYNAANVEPFIEAFEKLKAWFKEHENIHLFDYVSIPSVKDRIQHRMRRKGPGSPC